MQQMPETKGVPHNNLIADSNLRSKTAATTQGFLEQPEDTQTCTETWLRRPLPDSCDETMSEYLAAPGQSEAMSNRKHGATSGSNNKTTKPNDSAAHC